MRRVASFAALGGVAMLLLAVLARNAQPVSADIPHDGLQFSIAVPGVSGCDTTSGDTSCDIRSGSSFTLNIAIESIQGISGYKGYDAVIRYEGVTAIEGANTAAWPDCSFPASHYEPGLIAIACATGIPPAGPSTYTGVIASTGFTCAQSGSITMRHGQGDTDLVEDVGLIHAEGAGTAETLTINCTSSGTVPPTPPGGSGPAPGEQTATAEAGGGTPPPPSGDETPQPTLEPTAAAAATAAAARGATATAEAAGENEGEDDGDGGLPTWAWVVIGVAIVGVAAGAGYLGWRYFQQRRGPGASPPAA